MSEQREGGQVAFVVASLRSFGKEAREWASALPQYQAELDEIAAEAYNTAKEIECRQKGHGND